MPGRTLAEIAVELSRFMPRNLSGPATAIIGGQAASMQAVEALGNDLAAETTITGADGLYLDLLARGRNIQRSSGETDDGLRARCRLFDLGITKANITAAANAILAEYTTSLAYTIEGWDDGFADVDCWADTTLLCDPGQFFVLSCPLVGVALAAGTYADTDYLDSSYLGDGVEHPVYAAIIPVVDRLRASGVHWRLYIRPEA